MPTITIVRRTFEARKMPLMDPKRDHLNHNVRTSEYLPSYRYALVLDDRPSGTVYRTKKEAEAAAEYLHYMLLEK